MQESLLARPMAEGGRRRQHTRKGRVATVQYDVGTTVEKGGVEFQGTYFRASRASRLLAWGVARGENLRSQQLPLLSTAPARAPRPPPEQAARRRRRL